MMRLVCINGEDRGGSFEMTVGRTAILGRDPGVTGLQINDIMASRKHLNVTAEQGQFTIEDLGSANGSRINGSALVKPTIAYPGDILIIGHSSFLVEDPQNISGPDVRISTPHEEGNGVGTSSVERMSSQRLKKQLRRHKTINYVPEEAGGEGSVDATSTDMLAGLLTDLPMAVLVYDSNDRIIIANDLFKRLFDLTIGVGVKASAVIENLASHLLYPEDMQTLLGGQAQDAMRLDLPRSRYWLAWCSQNPHQTTLFLLTDETLGKHGSVV